MDNQSLSSQNRTADCGSPGVVSGDGGRIPPKPSGDRNEGFNAAGSSSGGQRGASSFPPTFSGDEPRPLETDFFRYCTLFFAHLGPEEESEQWASYLPENLRPGNIDKYLEETDNPQLFGNKYWWLSQENSAQERPSFNQSNDHIRYSRLQLLEYREVMAIPENILKIREEIEAECLGVNNITKCGETEVASISVNSMKDAPQRGEKENHEVANISTNSMQEGPQTREKEKQEGSVSKSKKEKKKCRVLSKERKEKRRIAKKKKRAEKNRKLGVKRLKIQPLLKPKPVSHCRHYLKGRCHEGEKCKFSHDVQPSTKSLPCCHFARQSCMKGDDCPYDHDLSKYPCIKYASTGFCPRQGNCLFSHMATPNQDPAPTKTETKASNPPTTSDSIQRQSQKPHFVFGAQNSRGNVSASKADQPVKAPQGLSFLNSGNLQKDKQPVPTSTSAHVIVSGKKTVFGGDPKGPDLPSRPPTLPNPAGVFVFGKNPPHNQDPAPTTGITNTETKASKPPPASDSIQRHSQRPHFVFGARNQKAEISTMAENSRANVSASKADQLVRELQGLSFLNNGNSQKDKRPSTSADVIVSGKKTVFGGDQKGTALPSNPPTFPNPAAVSVFGKNPPPDHIPPALPNSGGVFVFGKNPLPDHNKRNQPSLLPLGNNNKTRFSGGKKGSAAPSNSTKSAFSARLDSLMKNTSSSWHRSSLSTSAPGSNPVNKNQGTDPVSRFEPSGGTNTANSDASKKLSAVEVWEMLYGRDQPTNASSTGISRKSSFLSDWASGTSPVIGPFESGVNAHASSAGTNSSSAEASKKHSAVELWEALYGKNIL